MTLLDRDVIAVGPKTQVRVFNRDDVDAWQNWRDYDEPLLVGTSPRRMTPAQRDQWLDDLVNRQKQIPFAVDDENGRFLGRLFLRNVKPSLGVAVLGIDLDPDKLGQGYGTEALGLFLHHFFGPMGFTQMLLSVAGFNERARRSYDSLGFRVIGSHWDHQSGPDITTDSRFREFMHLFRRGSLGLETLFYDMALDKAVWEQTAHIFP